LIGIACENIQQVPNFHRMIIFLKFGFKFCLKCSFWNAKEWSFPFLSLILEVECLQKTAGGKIGSFLAFQVEQNEKIIFTYDLSGKKEAASGPWSWFWRSRTFLAFKLMTKPSLATISLNFSALATQELPRRSQK